MSALIGCLILFAAMAQMVIFNGAWWSILINLLSLPVVYLLLMDDLSR